MQSESVCKAIALLVLVIFILIILGIWTGVVHVQ